MNAALQGRKGALHRGNTSSMADKPSFAFLEAILNCELGNPLTHLGKQCGYTLPSEEVNLWCSETTAGLAFLLTTPKALSALSPSLSTSQRCPLRSILWRNNGGAMARFPAPPFQPVPPVQDFLSSSLRKAFTHFLLFFLLPFL